jgi:cell wall-associated NlpC family hydrolase
MQSDGNLVLYGPRGAVWSSQTAGNAGDHAVLQGDGNLVVYGSSGQALWNSGTAGHSGDRLNITGGAVTIYSAHGGILWSQPSAATPPASSVGQAIVNYAAEWIGKVRYCWDGGNINGPTHGDGNLHGEAPDCTAESTIGFDCTGLALWAIYKATGQNLFAVAHSAAIVDYGTRVPISSIRPGDILVFGRTYGHVGIYIGIRHGERWMIDANTTYYHRPDGVYEEPVAWETADPAYPLVMALRF